MASTKNYSQLHEKVLARPGAAERLAALRADTLTEIALYELRRATERSQVELAATIGISQSAISQLERGSGDIKLSTLRRYLKGLGADLRLMAVFESDDDTETTVPIQINDKAQPVDMV
jgi:transcriptional regulator with XRE-family HTH domain